MQQGIEVTIGEKVFIVTTFPALKGLKYLQKILKVVGPSIGEAFASGAAGDDTPLADLQVDEDVLARAISLLIENLDKADVAQLVSDNQAIRYRV